MGNKALWSLFLALTLFFGACQSERQMDLGLNEAQSVIDESLFAEPDSYQSGKIAIYVDSELAGEVVESNNLLSLRSMNSEFGSALRSAGSTRMERMFRHAGKYEGRTRREGLHRWYVVSFDEGKSVAEVAKHFDGVKGIELIEPLVLFSVPTEALEASSVSSRDFLRAESGFDDPLLWRQWHYENFGDFPYSKVDADIDLFEAWKVETGKPNVVVSVVDGGIDFNHPDLQANMWDDGKGNCGYNFASKDGLVTPTAHGTHVAGTIAAVNNNGIGVAGIAGGDGSQESGVRLMSCQIFGAIQGNIPQAIKYGADNGAVISQNSWGLTSKTQTKIPTYLKEAIDYFITYAGCDDWGNQLADAPMKGGVVIVAAGNENADFLGFPQAYSRVVSVAATAWDFTKASYSNYSSWVTISAPGGDLNRYGYFGGGVYSTLPVEEGEAKYGYMQGTSMACPHVSGVAALIVSKFGGQGFTADDLMKRLVSSIKEYDINASNRRFAGKLGYGHLSAKNALVEQKNIAPKAVVFKNSRVYDREIHLTWLVPKNEGNGVPARYYIYVSNQELTAENYRSNIAERAGTDPTNTFVSGLGKKTGSEISYILSGLEPETKFYFAVVAEDRFGLTSPVSLTSLVTTKTSEIEVKGVPAQPITMNTAEKREFVLDVHTSSNNGWTYEISGAKEGVYLEKKGNQLRVSIRPVLGLGSHSFTLLFTDSYGQTKSYIIKYEVVAYAKPTFVALEEMPLIIVGLKENSKLVDFRKYVHVGESAEVSLFVRTLDNTIVQAHSLEGTQAILKPQKIGRSHIELIVSDGILESEPVKADVLVVEDINKEILMVSPLPVIAKTLTLVTKESVSEVELVIHSVQGFRVLSIKVDTSKSIETKVDLSTLAPGNYTLYLKTDKETVKYNLIKS